MLCRPSCHIVVSSGRESLVRALVQLRSSGLHVSRRPWLFRLTEAELAVVHLVAQGLGDLEVAERLQLSRHTIRHQVMSAMRRSDSRTRTELIAKCFVHGYLTVGHWPPAAAEGLRRSPAP